MIEGQFAGCGHGPAARAARVVASGGDDQRSHGLRRSATARRPARTAGRAGSARRATSRRRRTCWRSPTRCRPGCPCPSPSPRWRAPCRRRSRRHARRRSAGGRRGHLRPSAVPMQWVPWPWPSCTASPGTKDRDWIVRPAKSGCSRSKPVSSTATRIFAPERQQLTTFVACRPQVAWDSSSAAISASAAAPALAAGSSVRCSTRRGSRAGSRRCAAAGRGGDRHERRQARALGGAGRRRRGQQGMAVARHGGVSAISSATRSARARRRGSRCSRRPASPARAARRRRRRRASRRPACHRRVVAGDRGADGLLHRGHARLGGAFLEEHEGASCRGTGEGARTPSRTSWGRGGGCVQSYPNRARGATRRPKGLPYRATTRYSSPPVTTTSPGCSWRPRRASGSPLTSTSVAER